MRNYMFPNSNFSFSLRYFNFSNNSLIFKFKTEKTADKTQNILIFNYLNVKFKIKKRLHLVTDLRVMLPFPHSHLLLLALPMPFSSAKMR